MVLTLGNALVVHLRHVGHGVQHVIRPEAVHSALLLQLSQEPNELIHVFENLVPMTMQGPVQHS